MSSLDNTSPRVGGLLDSSVWLNENDWANSTLPPTGEAAERIIRQYAFDSGLIDSLPDEEDEEYRIRLMNNQGQIRYVNREAYYALMLDIKVQIDLEEIII